MLFPHPMRNIIHDTRGQAVVEFALLAPLFLFLLFALVTVGYWMNAQQIITHAAQEGARIGALTNDNGQIEGAILATMASIDTNRTRIAILVNPIDATSAARQRGNPLTVRVEYTLPIVFTMLPTWLQKVASQSVARMEYVP